MALTCCVTTKKMSLDEYNSSIEAHKYSATTDIYFQAGGDGYYWFLYPYFVKLHKETGIFVDLYDDALFFGKDLEAFIVTIQEANSDLEKYIQEHQSETSISSVSGTYPNGQLILEKADIKKLQSLLLTLLHEANKTLKIQGDLLFFGD